jgi:hypothetical protein
MGSEAGRTHWLGMSRAFWARLGERPPCRVGSLGLARPGIVAWPAAGIAIADGRKYFPRERGGSQMSAHTVDFETGPGQAVLVTNPLLEYEWLDVLRVTANGTPLQPVAANDLSQLFAAPEGGGNVRWSVAFAATHPQRVDIVAFDRRPKENGAMPCPVR